MKKRRRKQRKFQTIQNLFILAFEFHHTSAEERLSDGQFCEFGYYRNQDFPTVIEGQLWGSEGHVGSVLFFSSWFLTKKIELKIGNTVSQKNRRITNRIKNRKYGEPKKQENNEEHTCIAPSFDSIYESFPHKCRC